MFFILFLYKTHSLSHCSLHYRTHKNMINFNENPINTKIKGRRTIIQLSLTFILTIKQI